jgi:hypothetical protein
MFDKHSREPGQLMPLIATAQSNQCPFVDRHLLHSPRTMSFNLEVSERLSTAFLKSPSSTVSMPRAALVYDPGSHHQRHEGPGRGMS